MGMNSNFQLPTHLIFRFSAGPPTVPPAGPLRSPQKIFVSRVPVVQCPSHLENQSCKSAKPPGERDVQSLLVVVEPTQPFK